MADLKKASSYKKKYNEAVSQFILDEIQPKLDDNEGSAMIYYNIIEMEGVNFKELKVVLKDLGYSVSTGKEGVDSVVYIEA